GANPSRARRQNVVELSRSASTAGRLVGTPAAAAKILNAPSGWRRGWRATRIWNLAGDFVADPCDPPTLWDNLVAFPIRSVRAQHRTRRRINDRFGHAAKHYVGEATVAHVAHYDQLNRGAGRIGDDHLRPAP